MTKPARETDPATGAVIVAAGKGLRAGGGLPKQYRLLGGRPVVARSVAAFLDHPGVGPVVVVVAPGEEARLAGALGPGMAGRVIVATGGASRDVSVRHGLAALPDGVRRVLIHDAARPLVPAALVSRVLAALDEAPAAAPAIPVTDALWRGAGGRVVEIVPRDGLFRAQTPQGFALEAIRAAHAAHAAAAGTAADDVAVALAAGLDVRIVEGDEVNLKITTAADFDRAERLLGQARGD